MRIYFFQKRNVATGELIDEYVDSDERIAWDYYKNQRFFLYIGWSDGRFMRALRIKAPDRNKDGIMKQPTKAVKDSIRKAQADELEFARTNEDKAPPRNLTKSYLREKDKDALKGTSWSNRG